MKRTNGKPSRLYVLGFYVLLFAVWQSLYSFGAISELFFPSPVQVARRLWELATTDGLLWPGVKATMLRMAIGFGVAALIGLVIGLLMGMSRIVNSCLKSLFLGLQTLPTAAWVPVSLLLFGLKDEGIYFVIVMSAMPAVAIATSDGILQIPPMYIRAAKTLGTSPIAMPLTVILPASLPAIVTGIKLGWTLGWHGAVSAELIKSTVGLGFLLSMGREASDAAQVIGIMLVTILVGLLLDRFVFGLIQKRIRQRWGLEQST
jgi:NitT/TauT family transport system permease protein